MRSVLRAWFALETYAVGLLAFMSVMVATYEMVTRYFAPQHTKDWSHEVVIYLAIWAIMLSSASLVRENRHIQADLIVRLLSPQTQRWLEVVNSIAGIAFCGLLLWYGYKVVEFAQLFDERSESSLRFPVYIYYLCLPVGMGLSTLAFIGRLYRYLFAFDPETMAVGHGPISTAE